MNDWVFQRDAIRTFRFVRCGFDAQTGVVAPPITYVIDGVQYVAVMAGAYQVVLRAMAEYPALQAANAPNVTDCHVTHFCG